MRETSPNEHIAKIAALPCVDRFCVFSRCVLALVKCWNTVISEIFHHVAGNASKSAVDEQAEISKKRKWGKKN